MKIRNLLTTLLLAAAVPLAVAAQEPATEPSAGSGDPWIDAQLRDIDDYGRRYREPFVDELVRYRDAPRELAVELLEQRRWSPGDAYFACALAQVVGRPCRYVADQREQAPDDAWSALAGRLGVDPGSRELGRIKRDIVRSYERWARPLILDAELRQAFPDHGKAPASADGNRAEAGVE